MTHTASKFSGFVGLFLLLSALLAPASWAAAMGPGSGGVTERSITPIEGHTLLALARGPGSGGVT
jgi:hypothetical protein